MVRVLHHVDDALSMIRESLLSLCQSFPLLIKIVNEVGQEELQVFKIDTRNAEVRPHPHAAVEEPQPRQRVVVERNSDDVQQELSAQREHILELESQIASIRGELRQPVRGGDASPTSDASDCSSSSSTASVVESESNDNTSEAEVGVAVLRLGDAASTTVDDGDDDGGDDGIDAADAAIMSAHDISETSSAAEIRGVAGETTSRKIDRLRKPIDRLEYLPTPASSLSSGGQKRRSASALEATTPTASAKKARQTSITASNNEYGADAADEAEIAALTSRLKEAYEQRTDAVMDSTSPPTFLQLVQQVFAHQVADTATTEERQPLVLEQWASHINRLITTSSAQKMLGYYLRSVLAHHLKHTFSRQYSRLARDVLSIKSATDIATYPAFFDLVQKHCPSIAAATASGTVSETMVKQWLLEPLFIADIGWGEWRRYLSKSYKHITEAAVQRFLASIEPFQDWMQLVWIETYDDEKLAGQGVRALREIHMPTSKARQAQRDVVASISVVAADLHCAGSECVRATDATLDADRIYLIQLDRQRVFDARHHWIGKINHLPMPHCNLRLTSNGKLVQIKPIVTGDSLTFDYGVDFWVYELSGLELSAWLVSRSVACNRGTLDVFRRMHDSVHDYTDLLGCAWVKSRPAVWSELERELWIGLLAEYLEERK
jgi:hypothetical protein